MKNEGLEQIPKRVAMVNLGDGKWEPFEFGIGILASGLDELIEERFGKGKDGAPLQWMDQEAWQKNTAESENR